MALLTSAVLAASLAAAAPSSIARHAGDEVLLVVTDADRRPLPGVSVRLRAADDPSRPGVRGDSIRLLTDSEGRARFSLPSEGAYALHLDQTGFLSTVLGPFVVCPASRSSCGPSLVTPIRATLPEAAFIDGAEVR